MDKVKQQISDYIDSNKAEFIEFWRELVDYQAGSYEESKITALLEETKKRLEKEKFVCHLVPTGKAPVLVAIDGPERPGKPIMLGGHIDTVFPAGTFPDPAFRIDGNNVSGPGVADMKGGIAMMLYMVKALREIGYDRHPIKIVLCGDEENTHLGSNVPELLQQEAKTSLLAFNMETGRMDNCLSVARKGAMDCHITVHGKGAHAGNFYYEGRNAIAEMALKIPALENISCRESGITVNVGVISGGTVANAVPDLCKVEVDCRFTKAAQVEEIQEAIKKVCAKTTIEGTTTELEFVPPMPVFEEKQENLELLAMINKHAEEYGFAPFGAVRPGGSSDVSYIAMAGIPAICSCGAVGEEAHTTKEHGYVAPTLERMKILAATIADID